MQARASAMGSGDFFDKKSARAIYQCVGFDLSSIPGGTLTIQRTLRSYVTTLMTFDDNQDAIKGYKAGREWFFEEVIFDDCTMTDDQPFERLHELTKDAVTWHYPEGI